MNRFWETLKVFIIIMLVLFALKAFALKPVAVPQELQQEAANAQMIHKGVCATPTGEELCMVGYDQAADTFWMLLFNKDGVLFQVVQLKGDNYLVRWSHPSIVV